MEKNVSPNLKICLSCHTPKAHLKKERYHRSIHRNLLTIGDAYEKPEWDILA